MSLPKGELYVASESSFPALVDAWPLERKVSEFLDWLEENFSAAGDAFMIFSDWDNEDDLESEFEEYTEHLESVLKRVWGHRLLVKEFDEILATLKMKHSVFWVPSEQRIAVDEIEDENEGEQESLEDTLKHLPRVASQLEMLASNFPNQLGHNHPPSEFELTAQDIRRARELVDEARNIEAPSQPKHYSLLKNLAELCVKVGKASVRYLAKKGDLLLDGFVQTFGPEAGKWTARGLAIFLAGEGVRNFGELLMKALN